MTDVEKFLIFNAMMISVVIAISGFTLFVIFLRRKNGAKDSDSSVENGDALKFMKAKLETLEESSQDFATKSDMERLERKFDTFAGRQGEAIEMSTRNATKIDEIDNWIRTNSE